MTESWNVARRADRSAVRSIVPKTAPLAVPFLKWAGGKGQLIREIDRNLPAALEQGRVHRYVEPFVGGGAVFLHIAQNYPIREFYISDINPELIILYRAIQENVEAVIRYLSCIESHYFSLEPTERSPFFYNTRNELNAARNRVSPDDFQARRIDAYWFERAAQTIFLNRTCYNGLFRVNSRGEFNVPFGRYKNPRICAADNLRAVATILSRTTIHYGDFEDCRSRIDRRTFVYFDPPYRPISKTSSFNSYARDVFDDAQQLRLANFYRDLSGQNACLMLSNSDPANVNPRDTFFEDAYEGFRVERVKATRMINSNARKRGPITELLIMNYPVR